MTIGVYKVYCVDLYCITFRWFAYLEYTALLCNVFPSNYLGLHSQGCSHCPTAMSTQPVRYSGYYDWFILLWPRHDHFSSWIKIKGVPFWKSNQFVVTQPNLQIIHDDQILIFWQRSKVLSIKLWPKLKFWHWSLCCWVPVSISVAKFLVTCQIYW